MKRGEVLRKGKDMAGREAYCSWCGRWSFHRLLRKNALERSDYLCEACGNHTVRCRLCTNMAAWKPGTEAERLGERQQHGLFSALRGELCAEHAGFIPSFAGLNLQLDDVGEYRRLFSSGRSVSVSRARRLLSGLPKSKLLSALLLLLPPGGLAAKLGLQLAQAVGENVLAAFREQELGLEQEDFRQPMLSHAVNNAIFGALNHFEISPLHDSGGPGPLVICVDGFMSREKAGAPNWQAGVSAAFPLGRAWLLDWDAGSRFDTVWDLPLQVWVNAVIQAQMTGLLLAWIIHKTRLRRRLALCGYSLGARVIYNALCVLGNQGENLVDEVYLFGGTTDSSVWERALPGVTGKIHNFYSRKDSVLRDLLRLAQKVSNSSGELAPVGLAGIACSDARVVNHDVSHLIGSHFDYKEKLPLLFALADGKPGPLLGG